MTTAPDDRSHFDGRSLAAQAYRLNLFVLLALLAVQIYLAGQSAAVNPDLWPTHATMGKALSAVVVFVAIAGWVARRPQLEKIASLGLIFLLLLQAMSIRLRDVGDSFGWLVGYHALGATLMVVVVLWLLAAKAARP